MIARRTLAGALAVLLVAASADEAGFVEGDVPADDAAASGAAPKPRVAPLVPLPPGPPPTGAIPPEVLAAAEAARDLPLPDRMKAVSEPFMGKPYALDGAGEGAGHDPDAFARYDAFDCLTFVEEVLALSLSGDPAHAAEVRNALRYGDEDPTYENRRHLFELQWIGGNVADGWIVDTTAEYGATVHMEREVTVETWSRWKRRRLFALTDEQLPLGKMMLDVMPLPVAIEAIPNLRPGSLVLTVREDRRYSPIWTTHLGFVVHTDEPRMRNASRRTAMKVLDERLGWYFGHLQSYVNWPVAGIAVFEPVEQLPRRSLVPTASAASLR